MVMSLITSMGKTGADIVISPSDHRHLAFRFHGFESTHAQELSNIIEASLARPFVKLDFSPFKEVFEVVLYPGKIEIKEGQEADSVLIAHRGEQFCSNFLQLIANTKLFLQINEKLLVFSSMLKWSDKLSGARFKEFEKNTRHIKESIAEIEKIKLSKDSQLNIFTKKMFKLPEEIITLAEDMLFFVEKENNALFHRSSTSPSSKDLAVAKDTAQKVREVASSISRFAKIVELQQWVFRDRGAPVCEIHLNVHEALKSIFDPKIGVRDSVLWAASSLCLETLEHKDSTAFSILRQQFDNKSGRREVWEKCLADTDFEGFLGYLTEYFFKDAGQMKTLDPIWYQQIFQIYGFEPTPEKSDKTSETKLKELMQNICPR